MTAGNNRNQVLYNYVPQQIKTYKLEQVTRCLSCFCASALQDFALLACSILNSLIPIVGLDDALGITKAS